MSKRATMSAVLFAVHSLAVGCVASTTAPHEQDSAGVSRSDSSNAASGMKADAERADAPSQVPALSVPPSRQASPPTLPPPASPRGGIVKLSGQAVAAYTTGGIKYEAYPDADTASNKYYVRPSYAPVLDEKGQLAVERIGNQVHILLEGSLPDDLRTSIAGEIAARRPQQPVSFRDVFVWPASSVVAHVVSPESFSHFVAGLPGPLDPHHLFIFHAESESQAAAFEHAYRGGEVSLTLSAFVEGWDLTQARFVVRTSTIREVLAEAKIVPGPGQGLDLSRSGEELLKGKFQNKVFAEITRRGRHVPLDPDLYKRLAGIFEQQLELVNNGVTDLDKDEYSIPLVGEGDLRATLTKSTKSAMETHMQQSFEKFMESARQELIKNSTAKNEDLYRLYRRDLDEGSSTDVKASVGILCFSADANVSTSSFLKESTLNEMKSKKNSKTDYQQSTYAMAKSDVREFLEQSRKEEFSWEGEKWTPKSVELHRLARKAFEGDTELDVVESDMMAAVREMPTPPFRVRLPGTPGMTLTEIIDQRVSPVGSIIMFGGAVPPSRWLRCDGFAVSRTTYATLFAAIGTSYGTGDGVAATFNLPDLRQRFPLGQSASGTGATLGEKGGAIDHVHAGASHSHDYNTVIAHSHAIDPPSMTSGLESANHWHGMNHTHQVSGSTSSGGVHSHGMEVRNDMAGPGDSPKFWRLHAGEAHQGTLATNEAPNHLHTVDLTSSSSSIGETTGISVDHNHSIDIASFTSGSSGSGSGTTSAAGAGNTAVANPPYTVVAYIIRAE